MDELSAQFAALRPTKGQGVRGQGGSRGKAGRASPMLLPSSSGDGAAAGALGLSSASRHDLDDASGGSAGHADAGAITTVPNTKLGGAVPSDDGELSEDPLAVFRGSMDSEWSADSAHAVSLQHSVCNASSSVSSSVATPLAKAGVMRPAAVRRSDIRKEKKFQPRKDMPPSSMLFQAMKRRSWHRHALRACCFTLVASRLSQGVTAPSLRLLLRGGLLQVRRPAREVQASRDGH